MGLNFYSSINQVNHLNKVILDMVKWNFNFLHIHSKVWNFDYKEAFTSKARIWNPKMMKWSFVFASYRLEKSNFKFT